MSARLPAEQRRQRLIEAAIDLFSRKGFAGTTTKEIAVAAGVTEAIVFRHFATKTDFYKAILDSGCAATEIEHWLGAVRELMAANDDEGLFRLIATSIIEMHREQPQFERLLIHAALEGHELAILHHTQMIETVVSVIHDYIRRRQEDGQLAVCDPQLIVMAIAGFSQAFARKKYLYQVCGNELSDDQAVDGFVRILMDGLRTRGTTVERKEHTK